MNKIDLKAASTDKNNLFYKTAVADIKPYLTNLFPIKFPMTPRNISYEQTFNFQTPKFKETNLTNDYNKTLKISTFPGLSPSIMPNGLYRFVGQFFNDEDQNIVYVSWTAEYHVRMNEDDF